LAPETPGEDAKVKHEDAVAWEDEEVHDPEATCDEDDDADDDITDKEEDLVKVEADAELLVMSARFIVFTGFVQTGARVSEEVLEPASTFESSAVHVEADDEACEEETAVSFERPKWSGKGGNILTPGDANRLGR
jgi:hypothetical protein